MLFHSTLGIGSKVGVSKFRWESVGHVLYSNFIGRCGRKKIPIKHTDLIGSTSSFGKSLSREVDFVDERRFIVINMMVPRSLRNSIHGISRTFSSIRMNIPIAAHSIVGIYGILQINDNFFIDE